jgi:hypothetical protein
MYQIGSFKYYSLVKEKCDLGSGPVSLEKQEANTIGEVELLACNLPFEGSRICE